MYLCSGMCMSLIHISLESTTHTLRTVCSIRGHRVRYTKHNTNTKQQNNKTQAQAQNTKHRNKNTQRIRHSHYYHKVARQTPLPLHKYGMLWYAMVFRGGMIGNSTYFSKYTLHSCLKPRAHARARVTQPLLTHSLTRQKPPSSSPAHLRRPFSP